MFDYYKKLKTLDLGDTTKVKEFLNTTVLPNIHNIFSIATDNAYSFIATDWSFANSGFNVKTKTVQYNKNFFTTLSPYYAELFDDYKSIKEQVESIIGECNNTVPMFSICFDHVQRHVDVKRDSSVLIGIMNCNDAELCFWENGKLADHVCVNEGDMIIANIHKQHSIILNDTGNIKKPRVSLMYTPVSSYREIISKN